MGGAKLVFWRLLDLLDLLFGGGDHLVRVDEFWLEKSVFVDGDISFGGFLHFVRFRTC
jgi:hypothetical protein